MNIVVGWDRPPMNIFNILNIFRTQRHTMCYKLSLFHRARSTGVTFDRFGRARVHTPISILILVVVGSWPETGALGTKRAKGHRSSASLAR